MKLLLDTHVLLWAASEPSRLSEAARTLLNTPDHQLVFSSVSIWEVSIKASLGRDDFRVEARRLWRMLLAHGYQELPLTGEHAVVVEHLPWLHKDPFDRILIAQSRVESMTLLTSDQAVAEYGEGIQLI